MNRSSSSSSSSNPFAKKEDNPFNLLGGLAGRNETPGKYRISRGRGDLWAHREEGMESLKNIVGILNQDIKRLNVLASRESAQDYLDRTYKNNPKERAFWTIDEQNLDDDDVTPDNVLVSRKGKLYSIDGYKVVPPTTRNYKHKFFQKHPTPASRDGVKYTEFWQKMRDDERAADPDYVPNARSAVKKAISDVMKGLGLSAKKFLDKDKTMPNPLSGGGYLRLLGRADTIYWLYGMVPFLASFSKTKLKIPQDPETLRKWASARSKLFSTIFNEEVDWNTMKNNAQVKSMMTSAINRAAQELGIDLAAYIDAAKSAESGMEIDISGIMGGEEAGRDGE